MPSEQAKHLPSFANFCYRYLASGGTGAELAHPKIIYPLRRRAAACAQTLRRPLITHPLYRKDDPK
jgi:hypothetical protein